MKRLRAFDYHEPVALTEATTILAAAGSNAHVLAGGTDLVVDMKMGRIRPTTVVSLRRIPELCGIADTGTGTWIGATTKVTAVESSPLIQQRHPALATAASLLASPPVRALATIGGNVGRASPASDLGPALIVSQAMAAISGVAGRREEPVEALYTGPGSTTLASSDIITSFHLPIPPPGFGSAHVKLGKRGGGTDIALAGVSASVVIGAQGEIADCRIALISLAPVPLRAVATEAAIRGEPAAPAALVLAAAAAGDEASPIDDVRAGASYRTTLAGVLTKRALQGAFVSAGIEVAP